MSESVREVGAKVAKKLAGLDLAHRAVMTKHTAEVASQVRRGARWQQEAWLKAGCGDPPEGTEATEGEAGSVGDDEEAGEMFNVGDVNTIYNFPSETKERIEKTHTTDATAVAAAVEKVQAVHDSPMGKWGRRLLYTALGSAALGPVVSVPLSIYAAFKDRAAPASASATVNVPPATDSDTDTTTEYELRIRPNPLEPGATDATN